MDVDCFSGDSDGEVCDLTGDIINRSQLSDMLYHHGGDLVAEKRKSHIVLTEQEIYHRLSEEVAATAEVLCVPSDWALVLLVHYRWNPLRLHEDWFAEQDGRIRDAAGLGGDTTEGAAVAGGRDDEVVTCGICTEATTATATFSAGCAHRYCGGCWRGYVAAALDDGRCLALRCPDASCSRAVLRGTVERFAAGTGGDDDAYARAVARAYVAARHRWLKPCTALGCGCAIELELPTDSGGGRDRDLACRCGNAFCWRCGGAPHWPASCAAAARWARGPDEASADWIVLHTKPCPRCRRPIEKEDGCDNMECAELCLHRFCWGCLAPAPEGADEFYRCRHRPAAALAAEEETAEQARARAALDRFFQQQDLWMADLRKRRDAEAELRELRAEKMPRARARGRTAEAASLEVVAAAWEQVAEGRRVLANARAHGRRLREEAAAAGAAARLELFEFQHRRIDAMLEELRERAVKGPAQGERRMVFDARLAARTRATRRGVEGFTKAVEEGHVYWANLNMDFIEIFMH